MLTHRYVTSLAFVAAACSGAFADEPPAPAPKPPVQLSPLASLPNGRSAGNNNQILTTGIRSPQLSSNHALIITVSQYPRSPLPGVLTDRKLAVDLAQRFGVPPQNIVQLSEDQVTREGLKQALLSMQQSILPGDKLYVYYSGHGARYFNRATNQCTESLVMQDMHVVTNSEFAAMLKPLSAKTDKTLVMLDSCHSGGVAQAASSRAFNTLRAKYSAEASSPQCSVAVNLGSFASRGIDLNNTDHNLVILAAARNNEVAWDTSKGGAMTYNFQQCLGGAAADTDHSGSLSMAELTACVQARLDKTQEDSARQHATLTGNTALVPAFGVADGDGDGARPDMTTAPPATPTAPLVGSTLPPPVDTMATLNDIYGQRDDRWEISASVDSPTLKIGSNLSLTLRSPRDGYVYLFYRGSRPESFYLLFPNQLDTANQISADTDLRLPRADWSVTALGPAGTDRLLVMVTESPRDFSTVALPAEYVSSAGPFEKIQSTLQAASRISQIALLPAAAGKAQCRLGEGRDLGVARQCSAAFGASLLTVEETN